jgi:hypothetical protein
MAELTAILDEAREVEQKAKRMMSTTSTRRRTPSTGTNS